MPVEPYCAREGFLDLDASETKQNRSEAVRTTCPRGPEKRIVFGDRAKEISEGNISENCGIEKKGPEDRFSRGADRFGEVGARPNLNKPTEGSILIERVNRRLRELIPDSSIAFYAAARYSLLFPGKRLRPALVLATCATFGGEVETALDPASAIEMVHTYSLIHDDLPCMDDDDLRRGRPTLHKVFPEGIALLAGDYLLTFSFEVIAKAPKLSPEERLSLIQILAFAAGSEGMIGGQAADISSAGGQIGKEALLEMHRGKTGALIAAALQYGAVAAHAPASALPLLKSLGTEIGLAFQFLDDLLDATASKEVLGKHCGRDAALKKPTAAALYGIKGVEEKLSRFEESIRKHLLDLPGGAPLIADLLEQHLWARRPSSPSDRSGSK